MYVFNIGSEKNIYFKSAYKAIKCSYTLPTYDQFHYISMPSIPWPGEVNPVPEILMKIGDKWTIINAFNGKTKTLPFELNYYNNSIIYNNEDYTIDRFINHAHINFMSGQLNCKACEGHGYIQMKDEYETITKTTYKEVVELAPTYSEYRKHDVIHKKVPVTTTEKVLKRGKSETCKQCKGVGIAKSVK